MFPLLREALSRLMDPAKIRHIGFSHFDLLGFGSEHLAHHYGKIPQRLCPVTLISRTSFVAGSRRPH
jgi:hypothetical protein